MVLHSQRSSIGPNMSPKSIVAVIIAIAVAIGGYLWWSRAPAEPIDEAQKIAVECQSAIDNWQEIRADPGNAQSRVAKDALDAAERCGYEPTSDDVSFSTS